MIIQFNMKTPDVLDETLNDVLPVTPDHLIETKEELRILEEREAIEKKLLAWFKYGEYLTVHYDTEKDIMTVQRSVK